MTDQDQPTPAEPQDTPPSAPPSARLQLGSQRADDQADQAKPKPVMPVVVKHDDNQEKTSYPPPNKRGVLSPELEAEYEAALGGASLDDILEGSAAAMPVGELEPESKHTGRIAKIHRDDVFVDLPGAAQGVLSLDKFEEPPQVGEPVEVIVSRLNSDEGLYELMTPLGAVDVGNWSDITEGQVVEASITGSNKGGLECQIGGIRGFMPMGQISLYRVETPEDFVGQKLTCVITEANPERRNLVVSHRAMMERERNEKREKTLAEIAPGQVREGTVRNLRDFGAFVDLGGVDGLIHISKMSWDRINHPSEVLEEGQVVKVKVERIDAETGKISLSYRDSAANPWDDVESKFGVGTRVNGTVSKTMDFGAFVKLQPGIEGLIHISELAHGRVMRTRDIVQEGQEVEVKVVSVDKENQRIGLSLKALLEAPKKAGEEQVADEDLAPPPTPTKGPRKKDNQLKGGVGRESGGSQFGLKW